MTDRVSPETRSRLMKSVRSKSKLEQKVCSSLWRRGLRFRKNVTDLIGKPDIAIKKYRVVIFIDSCFWHFCDLHCKLPESNKEFWKKKISRNRERDLEVIQYYIENKWHILRIWEHQLKTNYEKIIDELFVL